METGYYFLRESYLKRASENSYMVYIAGIGTFASLMAIIFGTFNIKFLIDVGCFVFNCSNFLNMLHYKPNTTESN